jgi:hypothetical protein
MRRSRGRRPITVTNVAHDRARCRCAARIENHPRVSPLLESRRARHRNGDRAEDLPRAQEAREVWRISEVRHILGKMWRTRTGGDGQLETMTCCSNCSNTPMRSGTWIRRTVVARTLQTAISFAAIAVMGGCAYDGPVKQHDADTYSAQYTTDHRMGCVPALAGAQLKAESFCYARQLTSQDTDKQCTETSVGFWRARVQFHCIQSASLSQPKQ